MQQTDPAWLSEARKWMGVAEIPGKKHNPVIRNWLIGLKAWWEDDETPWCGVFVAHCIRVSGRDLPKEWYRARAWAAAGTKLERPAYGCIVVFSRDGGGHVGFVVGQDAAGNLLVLGGNQGNRVSVAAFSKSRVLAYVWPGDNGKSRLPLPHRYKLPVGRAAASKGEA